MFLKLLFQPRLNPTTPYQASASQLVTPNQGRIVLRKRLSGHRDEVVLERISRADILPWGLFRLPDTHDTSAGYGKITQRAINGII